MPKAPTVSDTTTTVTPAADMPASYEAALEELEQLVSRLDAGQLPLDQLLAGYRRGAALLAFCRERLQAVEQQVQVLDGGSLKPWTPAG
jgi:exodeoxyribonuclease VII small subunit